MIQKIYYVANARMPTEKAHGIQIAKMCEALIESGVSVELVVPRRGHDATSMKEFYGLRVDVPLTYMSVPDWYGKGKIGFLISSFFFVCAYWRYLRKKNAHGALVWAIDIDQFSCIGVAYLGVPYIAEIHDAKPRSFVFSLLFRHAHGIVTINTIIKRELIQTFGMEDQKIFVYPNGVDFSLFGKEDRVSARLALGIVSDKPIVMYVGRVYDWKGIDVFVDAARHVPEALFYIVGGTAEELRAIGAMHEQPENLMCLGSRPFSEIPRWLSAADVLVATGTKKNTYSYLYTSPMKLAEYMVSGCPIVVADTPANREIVADGEVFFYRPDDPVDMAAQIRYILDYPDEAMARAERARQSATTFSWEKRVHAILKTFQYSQECQNVAS